MLYCFYFSDTEAFEACFRLLHDDDDDDDDDDVIIQGHTIFHSRPKIMELDSICCSLFTRPSQTRQDCLVLSTSAV